MKVWKQLAAKCCVAFSLVASAGMPNAVAQEPIKAVQPILITSFGQAPDGNTISVLSKRVGSETTYETLATAARIKEFKTVIVSLGVSLKGFGAAGVNLDTEMDRAADIIQTAKDSKIHLIGVHIGGSGRRDQMSNQLIEAYAGKMDMLVVYQEGNKDNVFTDIAKQNNIPIIHVEKLSQLKEVLQGILK